MYKAQAEAGQADGGASPSEPEATSENKGDDVQDVDFEEVK